MVVLSAPTPSIVMHLPATLTQAVQVAVPAGSFTVSPSAAASTAAWTSASERPAAVWVAACRAGLSASRQPAKHDRKKERFRTDRIIVLLFLVTAFPPCRTFAPAHALAQFIAVHGEHAHNHRVGGLDALIFALVCANTWNGPRCFQLYFPESRSLTIAALSSVSEPGPTFASSGSAPPSSYCRSVHTLAGAKSALAATATKSPGAEHCANN